MAILLVFSATTLISERTKLERAEHGQNLDEQLRKELTASLHQLQTLVEKVQGNTQRRIGRS